MKFKNITDFIDDVISYERESHDTLHAFELIVNYRNFISQQAKLEMFVPCDEEGNVLEKPVYTNPSHVYYNKSYCKEYNQAKEKVLFEGFRVVDNKYLYFEDNFLMAYSVLSDFTVEDFMLDNLELTDVGEKYMKN